MATKRSTPRTLQQLREAVEAADSRYPAPAWPISTLEQRRRLLAQIEADVADARLTPREAYVERLRFAYRCLEAGI